MKKLGPVLAVLALGACLVVVGCSSDDDDTTGSNAGSSGSAGAGRAGAGGASAGSPAVPGGAAGEGGATDDGSSGASGAGGESGAGDGTSGGGNSGGSGGTSGGSSGGTSGGGSGGTSGGGTSGSGGSGGTVCNQLVNLGTAITPVGNSAQKPNMTGGNIVDGTYILTSIVEYDTTSGFTETRKRTLKVNGNTVQVVNSDNGGPDVHATISIAPAGTSPLLNAAFTCPAVSGTLADYYTAASTSLQLRKSGDNQVYTYTLQNPG